MCSVMPFRCYRSSHSPLFQVFSSVFFFFLVGVGAGEALLPFEEYFIHTEPVLKQSWSKNGVPGTTPDNLPQRERGFSERARLGTNVRKRSPASVKTGGIVYFSLFGSDFMRIKLKCAVSSRYLKH